MAFADVGAHCSMSLCRQQDFLPFTCAHCLQVFCMEHRETGQHGCSVDITERGKMPVCPVCSATIKIKASDVADAVVNRHILSKCKDDIFDVQLEKKKIKDAKHCDFRGCHNKEKYETVLCSGCGLTFCLSHRHQDTHACPKQAQPLAKKGNAAASRLLDQLAEKKANKLAASGGGGGSSSGGSGSSQASIRSEKEQAAAKMRLRLRAKGDSTVKEHHRFYLEILLPSETITGAPLSMPPQSLWFDMNWTIGRVLEKIATSCKIENRNHIQDSKKLQMVNPQSNAMFPHDVALNLLIPELRSGDTVQLVYV